MSLKDQAKIINDNFSYLKTAKQDNISDLETIRAGATAGSTAVQPGDNVSELTNDAKYQSDTEVASSISTHNTSTTAHSDIRTLVSDEVTRATGVEGGLQTSVNTINGKIPSQATTTNQLADKSFVNSSIATSTANFVGTFNSLEELEAVENPTNNDYGFVKTTDSAGNTVYNRYKYVASTSSWKFEYALNNSSFTANQWAAINSGATSALIGKISTNETAISNEVTRATTAEGNLSTSISDEATRATTAEGNLSTSISAEETRAKGVEESLTNSKQDKATAVTHVSATATGTTSLPVYVKADGTTATITSYEGTAAKATADASGNVITSTYATKTEVSAKQDKLTAGANIQITNNTISATDTTYTAGDGIKIEGTTISNTRTSAEWGKIIGTLSDQTDLNTVLSGKQDTISDLATIRAGATAGSTAVQPGDNISTLTNDAGYIDKNVGDLTKYTTTTNLMIELGKKQNNIADLDTIRAGATAGSTAIQPNDNVSELTNDAGYITSAYHDSTKQDVISDLSTIRANATAGKSASDTIATYGNIVTHNTSEFATAAQGTLADSAIQPGDNISELTNDAKYQTDTDVANAIAGKIDKVETLPTASATNLGLIVQYVGATTTTLTNAYFYKCVQSGETYSWENIQVQKVPDVYDLDYKVTSITPSTTNFVPDTTYSVAQSIQRTANLFAGYKESYIDTIDAKIPTQASSTNQLADKAFVNSSIAASAASFRGNWATWSAVPTDSSQYPEDASGSRIPTNNDYLVVQDATGYGETYTGAWRFLYIGTWSTTGKSGWSPSYRIGSAFTSAQQAAIDSGVTSTLVAQISTNASDIGDLKTDKLDKVYTMGNKVYGTSNNGAQVTYVAGDNVQFNEVTSGDTTTYNISATDTTYTGSDGITITGTNITNDLVTDTDDVFITLDDVDPSSPEYDPDNLYPGKEDVANKVTVVDSTSSDVTYPTSLAVYSALNAKDATAVHKTGDETIAGTKTFSSTIAGTASKAIADASGNNIVSTYQPKTTAVTHTASTAAGSATVPVYVNASGVATAITSYSGNAATATKATQDASGNVITTTYVKKAGDTMTGALNFANSTWNTVGDDVKIGDCNKGGCLGILGTNNNTGIIFKPYSGSTDQTMITDGAGTLTISGTTAGTFKGNLTGNADTATKATQDASGNIITTTYETKANVTSKGSATKPVYFDANGVATAITSYEGNAATATKASQVVLTRARSGITDANNLRVTGIGTLDELTTSTTNAPEAQWFHYYTSGSTDSNYASQLALGMTTDSCYFRKYSAGTWGSWKKIAYTDSSITGNAATATKATQDASGNVITTTYATKTEVSGKADKATTLSGYGITDAYTKTEVDAKVSAVYRYKGSVATVDDLPTSGQTTGDVYNVQATGMNYAWNGTAWDALGSEIDLSPYAKTADLATVATSGSYNDLSNKPTIPTVNNATLTIQKNGTNVTTFTANSSTNATANITVPVKVSELTNDSGFTTNTGTITGITMNGSSKGTSGVVDLGTVITSHQDISGKQDKTTAVTHTASTAAGSATQPVYVNASGVATAITSYTGNVTGNVTGNCSGSSGSCTGNSATATKATQDSAGQQINTTYIKGLSASGTTVTYTKGDSTTGTITTQDKNVQSTVSSTNTNYPILLNNGTAATTNTALIDTGIYANPSTNTIGADKVGVANKVTMQYNSTTEAIEFVFA